jgi:hypothetical protein
VKVLAMRERMKERKRLMIDALMKLKYRYKFN